VPGYAKNKESVQGRLRRIEGQIRGLQKMVDEDRYCIDVLTQVNAARAGLESVVLIAAPRSHRALRERGDPRRRGDGQGARAIRGRLTAGQELGRS
jgi:DNA-binding FrmR family transcriptional regulator